MVVNFHWIYYLLFTCYCTNPIFGKNLVPELHFSSISNFLSATPGWNWQKIKQKLSNTLRLKFCYLKIIPFLHSWYHAKLIYCAKNNVQKTRVCVFNEVTWLIIAMKRKLKIKNMLHRYNINRTRSKHWHKCTNYSMFKNGCGQSDEGTQKLTISEKWTDGINWFFHVDTDLLYIQFCYLQIIPFLHSWYHAKLIEDIVQKTMYKKQEHLF